MFAHIKRNWSWNAASSSAAFNRRLLASGDRVTVWVSFAPTAPGPVDATLSWTTSSTTDCGLTGTTELAIQAEGL